MRARPWRISDADAAFAIYSDWEVARWLGSTPRAVENLEEIDAFLTRVMSRQDPPGHGFWAVETHDGDLVGAVLLAPLPGSDDVEVGWHLARAEWGKGYATEIATAALDHGFDEVGLAQVIAVVYPGNVRSLAVVQRLGMEPQGRSDRYYGVELEVFALDRRAWSARTAGKGRDS